MFKKVQHDKQLSDFLEEVESKRLEENLGSKFDWNMDGNEQIAKLVQKSSGFRKFNLEINDIEVRNNILQIKINRQKYPDDFVLNSLEFVSLEKSIIAALEEVEDTELKFQEVHLLREFDGITFYFEHF